MASTEADGIEWRLLPERAESGALNMALDLVAGETAARSGLATVRVYRWTPSTLSIGYAQSADSIDWETCRRAGIDVVRRPTGGGAILHDAEGDISYSIAVPASAVPGETTAAYRHLCDPIFSALEAIDVPARFATEHREPAHRPACYLRAVDPAHDIVVPSDGVERKISGNAQYRRRDAVIQHGSISYAHRPDRHLAVFAEDDLSVETFRHRTTDIRSEADVRRATVVSELESCLAAWAGAEPGAWTSEERERASVLAESVFGTEAWTRYRRDPTGEVRST